jgi:hypothetical protein
MFMRPNSIVIEIVGQVSTVVISAFDSWIDVYSCFAIV